ncbi:MAG: glycosyltransferase family 9 protein, partial [Aureliella sp.]
MSEKLAVFMPSWVGDAAMATPALRALHHYRNRTLTESRLIGVMQPVISHLLSGSPWFTEELLFNKRSWGERLRLAMQLRRSRVDTVLLLTNTIWTAKVAKLTGALRRNPYARDGLGRLQRDPIATAKAAHQNEE